MIEWKSSKMIRPEYSRAKLVTATRSADFKNLADRFVSIGAMVRTDQYGDHWALENGNEVHVVAWAELPAASNL